MRKKILRMLVGTVIAGALLAGVAQQSRSAASCTLTPQLREVAIDQGLPGYPRLVRGKETLVRPFFTLPSCADTVNGANIMVKSATLAVKNGTSPLTPQGGIATATSPLGPAFPLITTPSGATLPPDAAGNPIFVVPGSVLAAGSSTGASFTATFEITLVYAGQAINGAPYTTPETTTIFTTLTGSRTTITKPVEAKTNALRILAVPMGGVLSAGATTNLQNAMTTMSRIWPVPDGTVLPGATATPRTGDLFHASGGIRYSFNAGPVDLTGLLDSTGKFCGNSTNWTSVKSQLAQFLQTWNSTNTSAQADRVSGVGDPLTTISNTDNLSCAEGMASVISPESWFRASADKAGPTLSMEMCHTFGCVPSTRSDGAYHSIYPNADFTTGDANRGYNVTDRTYLSDDKNSMRYASTWTNANAIFGRDDFAMMLCKLGGATTTDCTKSNVAGTSSGVAAGVTTASFVMSGTTDGTKAGTKVLESFKAATLPTPSDSSSPYRLRQFAGAKQVADDGVPVSVEDSVHNTQGGHDASPGVFSIAFALKSNTDKIQLINTAAPNPPLYEANANAAPQISPPSLTLLRASQAPTSSAPTTGARASLPTRARRPAHRGESHAQALAFPTAFRPLAALGATYTVNSNADTDGATCGATCTLRQAINASNASVGTDTIAFNLPAGSLTITPGSALPAITDQVMIDGTTQTPGIAQPIVEINGSSTSSGTFGLFLNTGSGGSTIRGLVIDSFPGEGIHILSNGNNIAGNYVGTDVSGATARANTNGIAIETGTGNVIGGPAITDGNVISGNSGDAIYLSPGVSGSTDSNTIQGNYLGTNAAGTAALGNGGRGVTVYSSHNTIVGNVISANSPNIWILGPASSGGGSNNTIQANLIGTDAAGTAALGRAGGILLTTGASNNLIGGSAAADRNVIAGTGGVSVQMSDAGTTGNLIEGNYIGPDKNGSGGLALYNGQGVFIAGAGDNTIGGTAAGAANVIAYNQNANGGVIVSSGTGNAILGNSIFSNANLGIDLAPGNVFGVTPNDAGDGDTGPNNLQNFPVVTGPTSPGGSTVTGTLDSAASSTYTVEVFANTACDTSGYGEGQTFLGRETNVTTSFSIPTSPLSSGTVLTATATSSSGDTSEFSQCFTVGSAADTTPPNTGINSKPELSTDGTASFSFASDEPAGTFQCSLDDAAYSSCTSPKDYTGLANGPHVFRVYAVDLAGNADPTPEMWIWGVDTVAPPSGSAFDQHNGLIDTTRSPAGIGSEGAEEALVFKAGGTGRLTAVGFPLGCSSSQTVTIEIQGVSGGMPNGVDLAPATTTPELPAWLDTGTTTTFVHGRPTFAHAMLSSPVAVTAGTQYAIVLSSPGNFCYTALATTVPPTSSSFQGENVFSRSTSSPAWSASANIAFETFVNTAAAASADVSITKTDSPDPVGLGNNLTYTLTVKNNGPDAATAVQVTDPLPARVTFVSASASQGTCSGAATVTCLLGNLANGATATVTIVVRTTTAGSITNQATVTSTTDDPTPGNNSASESTSVEPAAGGGGGTGTGTNLRQITADLTGTACATKNGTPSGGIGVGVAFDGTNLLVSCYNDSTITVVNPANGAQVSEYTVTGASNLGALAWDKSRNVIWACSNFNSVGQINPTTHVFTAKFTVPGCFDGLAYDGSDDTIWTSPDATSSITHSQIDGTGQSTHAVDLGSSGNSGIAVGGANLYLANDGGQEIYTSPKDFSSSAALFASFPARLEDLECDSVTFASQSKDAIWSIDAYDKKLNAWEVPAGTCGFGGGEAGQSISYTATDTDTNSCLLKSDLLLKHPDGTFDVLAVGLTPTTCGSPATFNFTATAGCQGCEIDAKVYDGFASSPMTKVANSTETDTIPTRPVAAINTPDSGANVLQYDPVTLDGSGWDAQDGVLPGGKLTWSSTCLFPGTTKTGTSLYLSPPIGGWTPASSCTVSLYATDSNGNQSATVSRSFTILADADHDKIPASLDVKCSDGSSADNNALNDRADDDGDGIPNGQDPAPCTPATTYDALATFQPDPLDVTSTGNTVSMLVQAPYRDLKQVLSTSVAITSVNELSTYLPNVSWMVNSNGIGNAQFKRQDLLKFLADHNIHNRRILITISGDSVKSVKTPWSFQGVGSTYVKG